VLFKRRHRERSVAIHWLLKGAGNEG
jgi:hypothetical protein